jgi:hypothetical protein
MYFTEFGNISSYYDDSLSWRKKSVWLWTGMGLGGVKEYLIVGLSGR